MTEKKKLFPAALILLISVLNCSFKRPAKFMFVLPAVIPSGTPSVSVGTPDRNTNEFGASAEIPIGIGSEPASEVQICILSSDQTAGGTILTSGDVSPSDGTCKEGTPYVQFTPASWSSAKTISVQGSRGIIGAPGDTAYEIRFTVQSKDSSYNDLQVNNVRLTNLDIDNSSSFFVRTDLSGLSSGTLILKLNGTDSLPLKKNGLDSFPKSISTGIFYSVEIQNQPAGHTCAFTSTPYGNISSHIIISVECVSGYLFNGSIFSSASPPTLSQSFTGIQTIAGSFPPAAVFGFTDGTASSARFNNPIAVTTDGVNIYTADIFNDAVRRIKISDGTSSTIASVPGPHGVATDGSNIYAASYNTHKIYRITISNGNVTVLAGTGVSGDAVGSPSSAQFNTPTYLTIDSTSIYVSDRGNSKIKKISISDGTVSAFASGLSFINGLATDNVYIYAADSGAHQIKRYRISDGSMTVIAGTGTAGGSDNASGILASLNEPYGITVDGSFIYTLEGAGKRLRKISVNSPYSVSTIVPQNDGYLDGIIGSAQFCGAGLNCDSSLTTDGISLFFADRFNNSIRKLYY